MAFSAAILDFQFEWFSYFLSTSHPDTSYFLPILSQLAVPFRRSLKYIIKMAAVATNLDFWSEWF